MSLNIFKGYFSYFEPVSGQNLEIYYSVRTSLIRLLKYQTLSVLSRPMFH